MGYLFIIKTKATPTQLYTGRGGTAEGPAFPETPTISPLIAQGGRRG